MLKIAIVVVDRANWGRLQPLAEIIRLRPNQFDLHIVAGGTTVLGEYGNLATSISRLFTSVVRVPHIATGDSLYATSQSIGLGVLAYTQAISAIYPDIVIVIGDRSEALAAAIAAVHVGAELVHLQGGEKSGTLDQRYRWAITALAGLHIPATVKARDAIIASGVCPSKIIATGCPSADWTGVANRPEIPPKILVAYHPNTDHCDSAEAEAEELFSSIPTGHIVTVLSTNGDAGRGGVVRACGRHGFSQVRLTPKEYAIELASCLCAVGNSSGFVRDSSHTGAPVVLVGDRQDGRECGENVMRVPCERQEIHDAIEWQISHGRYPASDLYGKPGISERIVAALANIGRAAA